jgi:tripartite-type tricarboxylate transporter receptor subunit TctC
MALTLLASRSSAQDAYPTHPVRVIAASAAGGNPDVLARLLSARLSEIFNNPFVVEDVPGVGGVIAAKQTAAARPDGYTLGLNDSGSLGISIAMNPDANYTLKDFTPHHRAGAVADHPGYSAGCAGQYAGRIWRWPNQSPAR